MINNGYINLGNSDYWKIIPDKIKKCDHELIPKRLFGSENIIEYRCEKCKFKFNKSQIKME